MAHPIKHFRTITKHRHLVIRLCFKVGIGFQGLGHDLSKYSLTEFVPGAKYYTGYCSPIVFERKAKGIALSWMHHKGRNKHHIEYWIDIVGDEYQPVKMPLKYVKECFCDRVAASKIYLKKAYTDNSPLEYINTRESYINIHPETKEVLIKWLTWLANLGEKQTFMLIKKLKTYEEVALYNELGELI